MMTRSVVPERLSQASRGAEVRHANPERVPDQHPGGAQPPSRHARRHHRSDQTGLHQPEHVLAL